jgi:hypothetical protein
LRLNLWAGAAFAHHAHKEIAKQSFGRLMSSSTRTGGTVRSGGGRVDERQLCGKY